jgi:hypothetical protein
VKKEALIQVLRLGNQARALAAIIVAAAFAFQDPVAFAQTPGPASAPYPQSTVTGSIPPGQLDSMVAPIALYPDPLLSQVLVASTYPQEVEQAYQWVNQNPGLQGKALIDAAASQPWDPSVQALVAFPQALSMLGENIAWTSQLGNAFLSDQAGVFDAVQGMRRLAEQQGKLHSTPQQNVVTTSENGQTYIEILPANPQVVYVPEYQPAAIWGPTAYAYPPLAYPSTGALVATGLVSFGTGVLIGSLFTGGGWGWYPGWGNHSVVVNRNFISNNHFNRSIEGRGGQWRHNPAHNRGEAGRLRPGAPGVQGRPTVGETQRRLGAAGRQAGPGAVGRPGITPGQPIGPGRGSAQRLGPGAAATPRPGMAPGVAGRGLGQRMGPGAAATPRLGMAPGAARHMGTMGPRQGSAQRMGAAPRSMSHPRGGAGRMGGRGGGRRR